ncbi:MAG: oligopeptide/dipeptide ABC transporter ATP-binding protein [Acidimicrobiales bacterium]
MIANRKASLLTTRGLTVTYPQGRHRPSLIALNGIDLEVAVRETVSVVGESGSGKSTLGNAILGIVPATAGTVTFDGEDITHASRSRRRALTQDLQAVFQDPFGSLNPVRTIGQTLEEPLLAHRTLNRPQRVYEIEAALQRVGLTAADTTGYPANFSGGQLQRIAIARALMLHPKLVVCDEAVSALDLSIQAQILNLLRDLQRELSVSFLFITHDMAVVRHISDRVVVLYQGRLMESGTTSEVCDDPRHPYTRRLLAAAPSPDPAAQRKRRVFIPTSTVPPPVTGCPFRPRCPYETQACAGALPVHTAGTRAVACHHYGELAMSSP